MIKKGSGNGHAPGMQNSGEKSQRVGSGSDPGPPCSDSAGIRHQGVLSRYRPLLVWLMSRKDVQTLSRRAFYFKGSTFLTSSIFRRCLSRGGDRVAGNSLGSTELWIVVKSVTPALGIRVLLKCGVHARLTLILYQYIFKYIF